MLPWKKLKAQTVDVQKIGHNTRKEMFELFQNFYDNVSFEQFCIDMNNKTSVIILTSAHKKIRGFSTLTSFDVIQDGVEQHIIYSGDTIIDPSYWGTAALTMEFLKNIIKAKLRRPFKPVWWFLISKGYKTYLLMANNFINYFPRYDRSTPENTVHLMHEISQRLFPGRLDKNRGVLVFDDGRHEKLKEFVAPITDVMKQKSPKIRFFAERNPNWQAGEELICLGEVSLLLAIVHPLKVLKKTIRKISALVITAEKPSA
ncbi:MAG: hypothetical protein OHK0056_11410 [Bacteriovoracaceae bacterium]